MYQERDEQVIFLKDLIFIALYQWRKVLAVAIALALLLGGYSLLSAAPQPSASDAGTEASAELTQLEAAVTAQETYLNESLLMQIDPYAVARATGTISIFAQPLSIPGSTEPASYVGSLMRNYSAALNQRLATPETSEALEIPTPYLLELVSIGTASYGPTDGVVTVIVNHADPEGANKILSYLLEALPELEAELSQAVAVHSTYLTQGASVQLDSKLLAQQNTERSNLKDAQQAYKDALAAAPVGVAPISRGDLLKKAILFAVIGGILGICLVAGIAWVAHFGSMKVYSARTLQAWTGVPVLGCAPAASRKNPIDRWLRRLEGRAGDDRLTVAAATLRNYAREDQTLLVCADESCPEEILKSLCDGTAGIRLCGSLTGDVDALAALPSSGSVLLVVRCGKTLYRDIAQQAQLIRDQKKTLTGCIVLDG